MGAIAGIIFFCSLLFIGLGGVIAGIIGLIVFGALKRRGKINTKIPSVIFAIVLAVGFLVTLVPVGFFSSIILMNSVPPDGFVDTGILIDEDGYQDTRFTVDGVVYVTLELYVWGDDTVGNPVFTYRTDGFMNGSQCGNYYEVESDLGFDLVCDEYGLLFVREDEKEKLLAYYADADNLYGYYNDWEGKEFRLSSDEYASVREFLDIDIQSLPRRKLTLIDAEEFEIRLISNDGNVQIYSHSFMVIGDAVFYVCESDFAEDEGIEYSLARLPDVIAEELLKIHRK